MPPAQPFPAEPADAAGRWTRLLADLSGQLVAAEAAELAGELPDRTRGEWARIRLVDRFRAALGCPLGLRLLGGVSVDGTVLEVGADWVLVRGEPAGTVLARLAAVTATTGLPAGALEPGTEGVVTARLSVRSALRRLAQDRAPITIAAVDGQTYGGTIDAVGADFVELAEHPTDEPRRPAVVRRRCAVALAAIAMVRSR